MSLNLLDLCVKVLCSGTVPFAAPELEGAGVALGAPFVTSLVLCGVTVVVSRVKYGV